MTKFTKIYLGFIGVALLVGISGIISKRSTPPDLQESEFASKEGNLKQLNLKGDVSKLEIITRTTIPISEWFYSGMDFDYFKAYCREDAIYSFIGNSTLQFSETGNVTMQCVYDNKGKVIFDELPKRTRELTLYQPINIKVNELKDGWDFEFDDKDRIVRQTTSHDGKIFLDRSVFYNSRGDIDYITCNDSGLNTEWVYAPTDTTFFKYIKYDDVGNWTESIIEHKGNCKTDNYKMEVRRQFTYRGDKPKSPLIERLASWNEELTRSYSINLPELVEKVFYDGVFKIKIPKGVELNPDVNIPNCFLFQLPNAEGFFNMSVAKETKNEDIFSLDASQDVYDLFSYNIGQGGSIILRWFDYSNKGQINGHDCVDMKYAFYASGGYLNTGDPIIAEIIEFQPETDTVYSVSIGYDSYHTYLYQHWVDEIKKSITFN